MRETRVFLRNVPSDADCHTSPVSIDTADKIPS
jgi:hypothetical protein